MLGHMFRCCHNSRASIAGMCARNYANHIRNHLDQHEPGAKPTWMGSKGESRGSGRHASGHTMACHASGKWAAQLRIEHIREVGLPHYIALAYAPAATADRRGGQLPNRQAPA